MPEVREEAEEERDVRQGQAEVQGERGKEEELETWRQQSGHIWLYFAVVFAVQSQGFEVRGG